MRRVDDGLPILPKIKNSVFHFQVGFQVLLCQQRMILMWDENRPNQSDLLRLQEAEKIKRGTINWKLMMQNTDIAALIKRGKRLLA